MNGTPGDAGRYILEATHHQARKRHQLGEYGYYRCRLTDAEADALKITLDGKKGGCWGDLGLPETPGVYVRLKRGRSASIEGIELEPWEQSA